MKSLVLKKTKNSLVEVVLGEYSDGKFLQVELEQLKCNDNGWAQEHTSFTLDKEAALKLVEFITNNFKED